MARLDILSNSFFHKKNRLEKDDNLEILLEISKNKNN